MKIGIDGKPQGLGIKQHVERQCYLIEKYWHDRGFKSIYAVPVRDQGNNWRVVTNAKAIIK